MPEAGALALALLVTLVAAGPVVRLLGRRQVVDVPNARSSHSQVTPRGGGIAVMFGLVGGAVAGSAPSELWLLLGVAVTAALVGLVDDLRDLSAMLRLMCQFLLACGASLIVLQAADSLPIPTAVFAVLAVLWVAGYVNAFNFMDGINGISGTSGALAGTWFLLLGTTGGDAVLTIGGAVLVGSCLGFLPWNFPKAKVFLGDVGSYGIGMLVGFLSVWGAANGVGLWLAAVPLLVYVTDTAWTLVRRVARGDSWRTAHREHVYQRLCDVGFSHVLSTAVVTCFTVTVCTLAWWLPTWAALGGVGFVLALYLALPRVLAESTAWRAQRPVR